MRGYRHMSWTDRLIIEKLYNRGSTLREIAQYVGYSVSSVYAEVKRGLYEHMGAELSRRPYHYSAQIAQDRADYASTAKGKSVKLGHNYSFAVFVAEQIKAGRSVSHVCHYSDFVSVSTLYRYIDRGYIPGVTNKDLPEKSRRKCSYSHVRASRPPKGRSIEKRPDYVNLRSEFGHWEMDSVVGKSEGQRQSCIVLTERMTRYEIIVHARSKSAASTVHVLDRLIPQFPAGTFKTITVDNGSEFSDCYGMEHDPSGNKRLDVYYCHPYTSCERGSNERANRIIRRFLPKGKSMSKLTQKECDRIASFINTMYRPGLGFVPHDRFMQEISQLKNFL